MQRDRAGGLPVYDWQKAETAVSRTCRRCAHTEDGNAESLRYQRSELFVEIDVQLRRGHRLGRYGAARERPFHARVHGLEPDRTTQYSKQLADSRQQIENHKFCRAP